MVTKKTVRREKALVKKTSGTGKRTAARKAVAPKKAPAKKKSPARKTAVSAKRPAAKKKTVTKRKTVAKRKAVAPKKAPAKKKSPARKTAVSAKRPAAKKKTVTKRKTVAKRKAVAPKKAPAKKKSPARKTAVSAKRPAAKKKTVTKRKTVARKQASVITNEERNQLAKEEKRKKRIELLKKKRTIINLPIEGIPTYTMHRGESYMSPKQLEHFRSKLLLWKQDLFDEVSRTVNHMKKDASQFADPADRATQEEEFSLELRTRDREGKLVQKINQTLAAIDADEYGYCESCGVEIGTERLEARPTATLCIDCKTLQEIKEKQSFT